MPRITTSANQYIVIANVMHAENVNSDKKIFVTISLGKDDATPTQMMKLQPTNFVIIFQEYYF